MRKTLKIAALALTHFVAYTFCALREFDTNALFPFTLKPAESHATWLFLMKLLEFPFVMVGNTISGIPDAVMLAVFILNSLLWGTAIYYGLSRLQRRRLMAVSFWPILSDRITIAHRVVPALIGLGCRRL